MTFIPKEQLSYFTSRMERANVVKQTSCFERTSDLLLRRIDVIPLSALYEIKINRDGKTLWLAALKV